MKFMSDSKMNDSWILGLNFFQDYYVKFELKHGEDQRVGVWKNSAAYGKNNHSKAIQDYATNGATDAFADNSQDRALTDNLKFCRNLDVTYNHETRKCEDGKVHDFDKLQELYGNIIVI